MGARRRPVPPVVSGVDLDTLRKLKKDELLESRKKAIEDGCATFPTRIWPLDFWTSRDAATDLGHYVQEVTLSMLSGEQPNEISRQWKTASGVIDLPGDVAIQIGKDLADWTQEQFNHEAILSFMVDAAASPEEVAAISWGMAIPEAVLQQAAAVLNGQG